MDRSIEDNREATKAGAYLCIAEKTVRRMGYILMDNARHVKRAFECLRDVVHEVTFCHDGQLCARAKQPGAKIEAAFLRPLEYHGGATLGIATDTMARLLRTATSEQKIRMELAEKEMRFEMFTEQRATRFLVPTIDSEPVEGFDGDEPLCTLLLKTEHMRSLLRDLRHAGDRIAVEVRGQALLLMGKADNAHGEVVTKELHIQGKEDCYGVYSAGLMRHFLKSQHVSNNLTIFLYPSKMRMVLEADVRLTLELEELGGHL